MNLSKYKTLGVINRTPNSFSDHGLSLNPKHFESQLESFLKDDSLIVDVGFESTAPMNQSITKEEELARFKDFLEASKSFSFEGKFISFDTYRPENFLTMASMFKVLHPKASFIFNDVGGVLDNELKEVLLKFRDQNFYYIYTFSHIPERSQVLNHQLFLKKDENVVNAVIAAFKSAHTWFESLGMEDTLILDPGFGFSKTFEQNWELIKSFADLEKETTKLGISNPFLVGLSKKSFLKKALEENATVESLEALHLKCLREIESSSGNNRKILFRLHDPKILGN